MRPGRYEPRLAGLHGWPATLAGRLGPLCFSTAVVAFLLLSTPLEAQTPDPQQAALDDFVAARMLSTKCPSWQIDLAEARTRFAQLNLQPADWQDGGRHARFLDERLAHYGHLLSRMSEARACMAAEEAFGPVGRVRKSWMKRS